MKLPNVNSIKKLEEWNIDLHLVTIIYKYIFVTSCIFNTLVLPLLIELYPSFQSIISYLFLFILLIFIHYSFIQKKKKKKKKKKKNKKIKIK